jgi:hypothetical protein
MPESPDQPNPRRAQATPFQALLSDFIQRHSLDSGRSLSVKMGKSANHLSQILNDGLIPSGPGVIDMAGFLGLDQDGTDALIRAAIQTKMESRSRDSFWLRESARMLEAREKEVELLTRFLQRIGKYETFLDWRQRILGGTPE